MLIICINTMCLRMDKHKFKPSFLVKQSESFKTETYKIWVNY